MTAIMNMKLWCAGLAVAVLSQPRPASAQLGLAGLLDPGAPIETLHLRVKVPGAEKPVAAGERVSLTLEVEPKPTMHVYTPEQKQYLPVSLGLVRNPKIIARAAVFPKGEAMTFAGTGETQIVYSRPFRIEVPVTVAAGTPAGPVTVTATLEYQACDDRVCYAPRKVPVSWTLTVR